MPWCEYVLKSIAYHRMEKNSLKKFRLVAWNSRIGSHLDPKGLPKSEHAWMPIDDVQRPEGLDEAMEEVRRERAEAKERIRKRLEESK